MMSASSPFRPARWRRWRRSRSTSRNCSWAAAQLPWRPIVHARSCRARPAGCPRAPPRRACAQARRVPRPRGPQPRRSGPARAATGHARAAAAGTPVHVPLQAGTQALTAAAAAAAGVPRSSRYGGDDAPVGVSRSRRCAACPGASRRRPADPPEHAGSGAEEAVAGVAVARRRAAGRPPRRTRGPAGGRSPSAAGSLESRDRAGNLAYERVKLNSQAARPSGSCAAPTRQPLALAARPWRTRPAGALAPARRQPAAPSAGRLGP